MAASESQGRSELLSQAESLVSKLAGTTLLRASFAYGGELRLHFGKPTAYENPRLARRTRGEWVLGLRATPWVLVAKGAILSRSHDEPQHALRQFDALEGTQLTEARLRHSDVAITLRFADDVWFMALTEPRPRAKKIDLWELLTPASLFVVARPDRTLSVDEAEGREPNVDATDEAKGTAER